MKKVIKSTKDSTYLSRYIMGAITSKVEGNLQDYRSIEDNIKDYGNNQWVLDSEIDTKIRTSEVDGLHAGLGNIGLLYKGVNYKVGVMIQYYHISDYSDMDKFNEEGFYFDSYGEGWDKLKIAFPEVNNIVNPGGPDTRNMLNSSDIQARINNTLIRIAEHIKDELGK